MRSTLTLSHAEDHEDRDGRCGHCPRENLRWIMVLSDGSKVGSTCMKKVLGWNVATAKISWVTGKTLIASKTFVHHRTGEATTYTLWENARGGTFEGQDGYLNTIGGARTDWQERGWI